MRVEYWIMRAHERAATEKRCTKCGEAKPLTEFYFKRERRTYFGACKLCCLARERQRKEESPEREAMRRAKYRTKHQERLKVWFADWYQRNRDKVAERSRAYRSREDVRARERERAARYYAARRDEIQAKRKARLEARPDVKAALTEYGKRYAVENRVKFAAKRAKRRAAELRATPSWADAAAIRRVYALAARLTLTTGVRHVVDHIIPLQSKFVCGLHCERNLQVIPEKQNLEKFNKLG